MAGRDARANHDAVRDNPPAPTSCSLSELRETLIHRGTPLGDGRPGVCRSTDTHVPFTRPRSSKYAPDSMTAGLSPGVGGATGNASTLEGCSAKGERGAISIFSLRCLIVEKLHTTWICKQGLNQYCRRQSRWRSSASWTSRANLQHRLHAQRRLCDGSGWCREVEHKKGCRSHPYHR